MMRLGDLLEEKDDPFYDLTHEVMTHHGYISAKTTSTWATASGVKKFWNHDRPASIDTSTLHSDLMSIGWKNVSKETKRGRSALRGDYVDRTYYHGSYDALKVRHDLNNVNRAYIYDWRNRN